MSIIQRASANQTRWSTWCLWTQTIEHVWGCMCTVQLKHRGGQNRLRCGRCIICASQCISRVSKIYSKVPSWCLRPVTLVYHSWY